MATNRLSKLAPEAATITLDAENPTTTQKTPVFFPPSRPAAKATSITTDSAKKPTTTTSATASLATPASRSSPSATSSVATTVTDVALAASAVPDRVSTTATPEAALAASAVPLTVVGVASLAARLLVAARTSSALVTMPYYTTTTTTTRTKTAISETATASDASSASQNVAPPVTKNPYKLARAAAAKAATATRCLPSAPVLAIEPWSALIASGYTLKHAKNSLKFAYVSILHTPKTLFSTMPMKHNHIWHRLHKTVYYAGIKLELH